MQKIQNKAVRLIANVGLRDRITSEHLHTRARIDPINVRLATLAKRISYRMKETYLPSEDNERIPYLKLAIDCTLPDVPLREPKPHLVLKISERIFSPGYDRQLSLHSLPEDPDEFTIPHPRYV